MKARGRVVLTSLLWVGLALSTPLLTLRFVDSRIGLVAVLQSTVPVVALGVVGLLVVALLARRWRVAVVAGAMFALCASIAVPSVLRHTVPPGQDDLVVMSANLEYGGADVESLMRAARGHRVDVLVLIEITPAAVERLRTAGLDSLLPESVGQSSQDAGGTIIRSRIPLTSLASELDRYSPNGQGSVDDRVSARGFSQPVVSIQRPAFDVVLRAVHALPPGLSGATDWRSSLADLQAWREDQPASQSLLLVGDFNSSQAHPGFRSVAETMTDAHREAGQGWVRTWPMGSRIPPFIQLDHVLVRGLGVVDAGVVNLPGTDHAAVWARLSPHRSGPSGS